MRCIVGAAVVALLPFCMESAVAGSTADAVSCVATHNFYCDAGRCNHESEPGVGSVRLDLDLQTGTGSLCEYSQCRSLVASRFGRGTKWEAQLVLGPSSFTFERAFRGDDVEDEAMLPTLGAQLAIDPATHRFMVSEQSGTTLSGYFGTCEDSAGE